MSKTFLTSSYKALLLGLGALAIAGCATSEPTLDTSPDAELSFDGLYPVKGGRMDAAWARKDISTEPYTKIMLEGVGIEYRPGGSTKRYNPSRNDEFYALTDDQKARFQSEMRDAFMEELSKGEHFEIVTEPGEDVLLVRVGLLDVVSFVPPEPVGNADIYLSRVGEATLVLEMRDSLSNAILIRAVDRRAAEDTARGFTQSSRAMNTAEFRRVARTWGRILQEGLDRFMAEGDEAGE